MTHPVNALRSLLEQFATDDRPNLPDYTRRFREAFLAYGSETEDNLNAVDRIDVGPLRDSHPANLSGLRISKTGHSVTSVLNHLEGEQIPDAVRDVMPDLSQEDYDAALRVAVLCLTAFENATPK